MGDHARSKSKGDFCAVAARPTCGCSIDKDYVAECRPGWSAYSFIIRKRGIGRLGKVFEAHHILCSASVGRLIVDAKGKDVGDIVRQTEWCINTRTNMLAMPLWGHTVQWYCDVANMVMGHARRSAPPFANIPQHDWDHTGKGGYQEEVDKALAGVPRALKKQGHGATTLDLAAALDGLSADFKAKLKARGKRGGGTHAGWMAGRNGDVAWYPPFSMASDVSPKAYPVLSFDQQFGYKLSWLAKQLR